MLTGKLTGNFLSFAVNLQYMLLKKRYFMEISGVDSREFFGAEQGIKSSWQGIGRDWGNRGQAVGCG
jgi:hypothetical protein